MKKILLPLMCLLLIADLQAQEFEAKLRWYNKVSLGFTVSGVVDSVLVRTGQVLKKGEALVSLDRRPFEALMRQSNAELEYHQLNQAEAARELGRATELYERTQLSDHEKQVAEINAAKAKAELMAAEARKVQAELDMEYSVVRAPFDAQVVLVDVVKGQPLVSTFQSNPVVMVADSQKMLAAALVPGEKLLALKIGEKANVRIAGKKINATVHSLGMEAWAGKEEDGGSLYEVEVMFQIPKNLVLREGFRAKVEL